jgi:cysteinyl-tRNA synthetase
MAQRGDELGQSVIERRANFLAAMDDDFNTGGAIGELYELVRLLNKHCDTAGLDEPAKRDAATIESLQAGAMVLRELAGILGVFQRPLVDKQGAADDQFPGKLMELIIELRAAARKNKDFATADKIRNTLTALGVTLEDRASGTEWERAKSP